MTEAGDREPPAQPLNEAQRRVIELLGAKPAERPEFPADLGGQLQDQLSDALAPYVAALPDHERVVRINKHRLTQVHGCETHYLDEQQSDFEWSARIARGTVVHKALELSMNWRGDINPMVLVDNALDSLEVSDKGIADYLSTCPEVDRAELRSLANQTLANFMESWPPLKSEWRPVCESSVKVGLFGGRIMLAGKVDLTLGQAEGRKAGKVLVDYKTGMSSSTHMDDLRFYALLETIMLGTPPRLVASYYLNEARFTPESVDENLLQTALARTADGVARIIELEYGDAEATKRPGHQCGWCVLAPDCEEGQQHLNTRDR